MDIIASHSQASLANVYWQMHVIPWLGGNRIEYRNILSSQTSNPPRYISRAPAVVNHLLVRNSDHLIESSDL